MKTKNALITGGAGFIGSRLSLALIERGYTVTVLDNLSPQVHGVNSSLLHTIAGKVRFIKGDVRFREDWEKALDAQDIVVHLAAETGTGQSMYEIERYVDVNVKGTALLLEMLGSDKRTVKKVVVASSRAVYGEGKYVCTCCGIVYPIARKEADMLCGDFSVKCPECGQTAELLPTDENSKLHPTSIYGITKLNQEQMVLTVCKSLGLSAVALRYQNVYGPGQSLSNPYTGILSIFSTRIKNNNEIVVFEDGEESRDFIYIDDVIDATMASIELGSPGQHVFNVGSGIRTSVKEIARTLIDVYSASVPIRISGNFRLGDIRDNYADMKLSSRSLGISPKVTFAQGVRQFAQWVDAQTVIADDYEKSIEELRKKGLYK